MTYSQAHPTIVILIRDRKQATTEKREVKTQQKWIKALLDLINNNEVEIGVHNHVQETENRLEVMAEMVIEHME
jgi:hypothetical protein